MKRISKAEWLEKALNTLETDGVRGIRVEVLAKSLGVSKSGFYWHFKDRDDLLRQVLDYWAQELTMVVSSNEELQKAKPKSRLGKIATMILNYDLARYEIPIRQWALHDSTAASAVKKVNRLRLDFVRQAFSELGFKDEDLEMRTMLFACYHTWESPMFPEVSRKRRREQIARRIELLTKK
jgi:AcrR family transcriptional regulator